VIAIAAVLALIVVIAISVIDLLWMKKKKSENHSEDIKNKVLI
jgi:Tfp pilus assembly protein FimT